MQLGWALGSGLLPNIRFELHIGTAEEMLSWQLDLRVWSGGAELVWRDDFRSQPYISTIAVS